MRKLLRANFFCLRKSKAFWCSAALAFVFTAVYLLRSPGGEDAMPLDTALTQVYPFLPILHAAFLSLFLGLEYQDGTLRNKCIAGHSRAAIYGAYFLTATAGCFFIVLAWLLGGLASVPKLGWFTFPALQLAKTAALILAMTAAISAILTLVCMLLPNRAASAVTCLLLVLGLIVLASFCYNALCEPQFASGAVITSSGFVVGDEAPNPDYVSGALRQVYQAIVHILPTGQAILLANEELTHPLAALAASLVITLATCGCGLGLFERKDLK